MKHDCRKVYLLTISSGKWLAYTGDASFGWNSGFDLYEKQAAWSDGGAGASYA